MTTFADDWRSAMDAARWGPWRTRRAWFAGWLVYVALAWWTVHFAAIPGR